VDAASVSGDDGEPKQPGEAAGSPAKVEDGTGGAEDHRDEFSVAAQSPDCGGCELFAGVDQCPGAEAVLELVEVHADERPGPVAAGFW